MAKYTKRDAKPVSARLIEAKSGNQGIEVEFRLEEPSPEGNTVMRWVGWLGPNSIENTMNTLTKALGSNGVENVDSLGRFTDPGFVNKDKVVSLSLDYEIYEPEPGKHITIEKVKFVNSAGSKFKGISTGTAQSVFANVGFKAAFLKAQKENQDDSPPPKANPNEEIPF